LFPIKARLAFAPPTIAKLRYLRWGLADGAVQQLVSRHSAS
jgi:hypothetical protein